jgi:hypothetical protein
MMEHITRMLCDQMLGAAKSAVTKTDPNELTASKRTALLYYAGVPFKWIRSEHGGGKMTMVFEPAAIIHDGERWVVGQKNVLKGE